MLKTNRFLYVLPDLSFTAMVAPAPKDDYFFIQNFHQINGEFIQEENLLPENLKKLFPRIEAGNYILVLPDFLFTDTIVNVPATQDDEIATYLRDQLLPKLDVSIFSHETKTSILLQRGATSKVQLSALEKELLATIKLAIGNQEIKIDEIVPLSWTLKAAVSLEPSLTIAQLGEYLYLAEHYIGINQTMSAPLNDLTIIGETIKTIKGGNPNLQTAYLLTSDLVETKLKKLLNKTLPIQQLTEATDDKEQVPSYVKQIVEIGARTLSLPEFIVPRFDLQVTPRPAATAAEATTTTETVVATIGHQETAPTAEAVKIKDVTTEPPKAEAKAPHPPAATEATTTVGVTETSSSIFLPKAAAAPVVAVDTVKQVTETINDKQQTIATSIATAKAITVVADTPPATVNQPPVAPSPAPTEKSTVTTPATTAPAAAAATTSPLSFMSATTAPTTKIPPQNETKDVTIPANKQKGGMNSFFKKLFLFLLIFIVTIALGIGIGWGILTLTNKDVNFFQSNDLPTPEPTILPTPEPVEEASTAAEASAAAVVAEEIDVAKQDILIVNATGVAGLAGKTKTALETEGFSGVKTGNAQGDYENAGNFVLMKEKNSALIKALEEASGLTLTYDEDYQTEDSAGTYDAVIVLNQK